MSVLFYGPDQVKLTFGNGNHFLAHLQVATHRRFAEGRGYFLTLAGRRDDDGQRNCFSFWGHPSIPLLFSYDTEDITGARPDAIQVTNENVEALLEVMDRPLGVLWGFVPEQGIGVPFTGEPRSADTDTA